MNLISPRHDVEEFRRRYKWMAFFAVLVFLALAIQVGRLQLGETDEWSARSFSNITDRISIAAPRGVLRDRRGRIIADNHSTYALTMNPSSKNAREHLARALELIDADAMKRVRVLKEFDELSERRRTQRIDIVDNLTRPQLAAIETHLNEVPSLAIRTSPKRRYPFKELAAHAIGYVNEVNADDLKAFPDRDYRAGEVIGRSGLEKVLEQRLRGKAGFRRQLIDSPEIDATQFQAQLESRQGKVAPIPGEEIYLTLDMELHQRFEKAFEPYASGAAVVVEINSGEVYALYSKPAYDPNEFSAGISQSKYNVLLADSRKPLIDKTVYETYFPGSTFKPFTAFSILEGGGKPSEAVCTGVYQLGGQRFRCTHVHGKVDFDSALTRSCNVYYWKAADFVSFESITHSASLFGLGERTGIILGGESKGMLPTREWYQKTFGAFRPGYVLNTAIGQGNTRATVLQIAMAYTAIANKGNLLEPKLVVSANGVVEPSKRRRHIDFPTEWWTRVSKALRDVVQTPSGTAFRARDRQGMEFAGKTGTAEVIGSRELEEEKTRYEHQSHGWFAGYVPADAPRFAFAVVVEHGGYGGSSAAPIAIGVLSEYLRSMEPLSNDRSEIETPTVERSP